MIIYSNIVFLTARVYKSAFWQQEVDIRYTLLLLPELLVPSDQLSQANISKFVFMNCEISLVA